MEQIDNTEDSKKTTGNPLWISGKSGNPSGRPKGTSRSAKRNLERLAALILTVKELKNNYDHMKAGTERWQMQKELASWLYPKAQANSISDQDVDLIYQKVEQTLKDAQRKAG